MREFCFIQADNCLTHHGLATNDFSRVKLAKAIGAAFRRASLTLMDLAEGRIGPDKVSPLEANGRSSPKSAQRSTALAGQPDPKDGTSSLTVLFDAWWHKAKAAGRKPSTHES